MSHRLIGRHLLQSALILAAVATTASAHAADLTWNGWYRVEGVKVENSELSSQNTDKSYMLHHLILMPKLVVGDGLTIHSRLDILNSTAYGINANGQVSSVAGDLLGNGPGTPATTANPNGPSNGTDSNSWGQTQNAGQIAVTELYLSWAQEFGQFVVGRVPLQFGLGTAFNAGNGLFDHYLTTKDLVGYKVILGNFFVMPMKAKTNEGALNTMADVDDYMVQAQYENPETQLTLGFMYDMRVVTGNDSPISNPTSANNNFLGGPGATRTGSYKNSLMSFFFTEKPSSQIKASVEVDLAQGDTGIQTAAAAGTSLNAFGIAAEFAWLPPPAETKWSGLLKVGMATGDDPGTYDVAEGYQFNRNYQVAQLMFHQPLGQTDILRTGFVRNTNISPSNQLDDEAISNAMYLAPSFKYQSRENLAYGFSLIYARLNKDPIGPNSGTGMTLGYEADLNITYKPVERLTWISGLGALLPGDAWRAGSKYQFENRMAYGVETKAAISF